MPKSNQDYTARRFQSFDTEKGGDGYDCELPFHARNELAGPRRPPIARVADRRTREQVRLRSPRGPLYFVLLLVIALLIGGAAVTLWHQWNAERARGRQAISQSLAPQPAPTPVQTLNTWQQSSANNASARAVLGNPAPRAQLVKLPPPRAQLVRLPEWRVGETRPVMMPYNTVVADRKTQMVFHSLTEHKLVRIIPA
jgi:hypothetical protein